MNVPIEGYLLKITDGSIWEVKGFMHPDGALIAFPRYILDRGTYVKVSSLTMKQRVLDVMYSSIVKYSEVYDMMLPHVPIEAIVKVYDPKSRALEIYRSPEGPLEKAISLMLHKMVEYCDVEIEGLGITGSLLPKLQTLSSDIDLIVYGLKPSKSAYQCLKALRGMGIIKPLGREVLYRVLEDRRVDTPILDVTLEKLRVLQGSFRGIPYSIKMTLYDNAIPYGTFKFEGKRTSKFKVKILASNLNYLIPWPYQTYILEPSKFKGVAKIYTLRMRFTEVFTSGMLVSVYGRFERVMAGSTSFNQITPDIRGGYMVKVCES